MILRGAGAPGVIDAAPATITELKKTECGVQMATKTNTKTGTNQTQGETTDGPLLDNLNAEVKKMIARGKEVGYVTYDQLNAALPPDQVSTGGEK